MEKDKIKSIEDLIVNILDEIIDGNDSVGIFIGLDNILKVIESETCIDNLLECTSHP